MHANYLRTHLSPGSVPSSNRHSKHIKTVAEANCKNYKKKNANKIKKQNKNKKNILKSRHVALQTRVNCVKLSSEDMDCMSVPSQSLIYVCCCLYRVRIQVDTGIWSCLFFSSLHSFICSPREFTCHRVCVCAVQSTRTHTNSHT